MVGQQRSTRRPPRPQDDNRNDVDEQRNNDNSDYNDDHRGAVETNSGESDGANCYLALFDNTTIQYVVVAMVEWLREANLIFAGYLNVDLERMGGW